MCQLNDEQLKDDYCDPNNKPESVISCELQECAYWHMGPWGPVCINWIYALFMSYIV